MPVKLRTAKLGLGGREVSAVNRRAVLLTTIVLAALAGGVGAAQGVHAQAQTCANEAFRTGASGLLPNCRAFEQVSPVDKNGGDILWDGSLPPGGRTASLDGGRLVFASAAGFADNQQSGGSLDETDYLATRGPFGWTTEAMVPAVDPGAALVRIDLSTPDLGQSLLASTGVLATDPPSEEGHNYNIYHRDNDSKVVSSMFGITTNNAPWQFVGPVISEDASHLAFGSAAAMTDDPVSGDIFLKVYEWTGNDIRLVSVDSGGTPFPHAGLGSSGEISDAQYSTRGAISDDGRHIFFNAASDFFAARELYRRTDGTTTVLATPSKRTSPDPEGVKTKIFWLASDDGSRVFFTSAEHLTDNANTGPARNGADLYRYDVEADEMIDVSATAGGDGARVRGVIGASAAGDRVYYVAMGQVAGQGSASGTEPNLYLWEDDGTPDGATRFIATLATADSANWASLDGAWTARVSGDGRQLLFQSEADIPGHDGGDVKQIYHYDSDGNGGAGLLSCVSCNPEGDDPIGDASIPTHVAGRSVQRWEHPRALSDDGSRVFFNTPDDLVERDSNGEIDAYMWENGEVSLLSTGTSSRESRFYNASASGDDAFILTAEPLVSQDIDDLVDLYDARVGGGLPMQVRDDCDGEGCQGLGSGAPPAGALGSTHLTGRGDVESGTRLVLGIKRPSKAQLRKLARGRTIGVRVRVSRAAKVRLVARTRGQAVASGFARARRAGSTVVRLRLNRATRHRLSQGDAVRLSLSARASGARPRTLVLRLAGTR